MASTITPTASSVHPSPSGGGGGATGPDPLRTMHPNELAKMLPPDVVENKAMWPIDQRRELLKRLLDLSLEESIPTEGLMKAFKQPLTVEAFTSLITMDPTPLGDLENDFADSRYQKPNIFDTTWKASQSVDEDDDMKRAHRAMRILTADQPQINMMMRSQPNEIIAPIFRAFRCQGSKASIYHLCKVLDAMVKVNCEAVLMYLTGPRMKVCLNGMLCNLQCSVVIDSVFNLLKVRVQPLENNARPETVKVFHKKVQQFNPVGILLSNIVSEETSLELKLGSADLLSRLLTYFDSVPVAAPNDSDLGESFLFKSLCTQDALEKLVRAASKDNDSYEPALSVFSMLCKLAAKGKLATAAPVAPVADEVDDDEKAKEVDSNKQSQKNVRRRLKDFSPPPPPPVEEARLAKLGNELKPLLKTVSITSLCAQALEATDVPAVDQTQFQQAKHTSYEVTQPFSYRRFELLRSLNHLLELNPQTPVPWKSLVAWQAQYPQNSLVQNEFSKALQTILVNSPSSDECRPAICECKLITQLIKRAKDYDTDHAHVLKCLNLLRLKADLLPKTHWLVQYLKSHSGWVDYLPELKKATRVTLEPWLKDELPSQETPVVGHGFASTSVEANKKKSSEFDGPAAALNALFMSDPDNPLTALTRQISQEHADQEKAQVVLDLELGSRFAKSLGFTSTVPITLPSEGKQTSTSGEAKAAPTAGATPPERKKSGSGKKKKKG